LNNLQNKITFANAKTKYETGFDYVVNCMNIITPFGRKALNQMLPFLPGQENLLREEYQRLGFILEFVKNAPKKTDAIIEILKEVKDLSFTIQRSDKDALSVVELFEVKSLLLKMDKILIILKDALAKKETSTKIDFPKEYLLKDVTPLIKSLDPRNEGSETFYLYDEFSDKLREIRERKRIAEADLRKEQKELKDIIKQKHGIELSQRFDCIVSKANAQQLKALKEIPELIQISEDYISVVFSLKNTAKMDGLFKEIENAMELIEAEELAVREKLSKEIGLCSGELLENCEKIGALDVAIAKTLYAINSSCTIPKISDEYILEITDGRHIPAFDAVVSKNKKYCPVSISLSSGTTCISGANMGGKTVTLKLVGLVALLTQHAFFVPCEKATLGLSNYVQMLIGDSQSLERGLSSFGGEVEELKETLDNAKDRSLILIDEIASGTNPHEGFALMKSIVDYLSDKPYISLLTTHFDGVASSENVNNLQVIGLANVDFDKLNYEIKNADSAERVSIIASHMDYRLQNAKEDTKVPKDALNIAKMLGIKEEIIEAAKKYL